MTERISTQMASYGVFVASSNENYLDGIERALRSFYVVRVFSDKDEVIDAMGSDRPSVLIVDERFTDCGGFKFIQWVRKQKAFKSLPIVYTAKHKDYDQTKSEHEQPFTEILFKPYLASKLLRYLSKITDQHVKNTWSKLDLNHQNALQNTLDAYNSIADCISEGKKIPFSDIEARCSPLVEVIRNDDYNQLLTAVREHDNYSYIHSFRVATFLTLFGKHYDIPDKDLPMLAAGGLLHDIGKLTIPFAILNKPSELNVEEWQRIKTHVEETVKLLDKTEGVPEPVKIIAGQHHERLDGSGYPQGIQGEELNYLARIAALVDVFCALTDRRSYKGTLSPIEAIEIMENMHGHLDQHLLLQFKDMLLRTAKEEGLLSTDKVSMQKM